MRERFRAPTVLVVVQGGAGTLKTVYEGLRRGIPTVIVGGTGGAADLLIDWLIEADDHDQPSAGQAGNAASRPASNYNPLDDGLAGVWLKELRAEAVVRRNQITWID
eukprot:6382024-Prymnesium_polylepis.1